VPGRAPGKPVQFAPIRFVASKRPNTGDRLLLAFDALALSEALGSEVAFGRIIHGEDYTSLRVRTSVLESQTRQTVAKAAKMLSSDSPPELVLNRHCPECEFQARCRQKAVEADDLSLFSGMRPEERERHRRNGIFTVNQLSYTFRPRRGPKRAKPAHQPHYFALQALALRENSVYINGSPQLPSTETTVYLDVEGLSASGPYYLAGALIVSPGQESFYSFWADQVSEESAIFTQLAETVSRLPDFRIFHYGSYDAAALKLVRPRLPEPVQLQVDLMLQRSINVLSVVYQHLYFPTYSNSLKELCRVLGFQRTAENLSGLQSILWRRSWETDLNPETKAALIGYNRDDCFALKRLCEFIRSLGLADVPPLPSSPKLARAEEIQPKAEYRVSFGLKQYANSDLQHVNKCGYFDYQREKVLMRTHPHLKPNRKARGRINPGKLHPNKTVTLERESCRWCGSKRVERKKLIHYFLLDLKFTKSGVRRFVTRFSSWNYWCLKCKYPFSAGDPPGNPIKFGRSVMVWCMYWSAFYGLNLARSVKSLEDLFGFRARSSHACRFRWLLSLEYKPLYDEILASLLRGSLLHMDETTVRLQRKQSGYVWVMTSLDRVYFFYKPNREGAFLAEMLKDYPGVLISDFYSPYDSMTCPQQKCLIHFIRDIDDDLLRNPLDEELKAITQEFGDLLKSIMQTLDRYGLKKRHLHKHKRPVSRFLASVNSRELISVTAKAYQKRFEKSGPKLFTFLDYDGVPWNNNNAEHAIKGFAKYRRVFDGYFTKDSLQEYLVLASVFRTCELNHVNVLEFLLSGEKTLAGLLGFSRRKPKNFTMPPLVDQTGEGQTP
jgi:predicted RecB family nuclease